MVFGEIICKVIGTGAPKDLELALVRAIAEPVETHVNGFGPTLFDSVVDNAGSAAVINLNGSGRLRVTHVREEGAKHDTFSSVKKGSAKFGFSGGGENDPHNGAECMDGTIIQGKRGGRGRRQVWILGKGTEEEVAASAAARFGRRKIGGIAVDSKNHVAGMEANFGIRVSGTVVEEVGDGESSIFGSGGGG